MVEYKSADRLQDYAATYSYVVDYAFWEDEKEARTQANADFKTNKVYTPDFSYPKINDPLLSPILDYDMPPSLQKYDDEGNKIFDTPLIEKKSQIYQAVMELEANKDSGIWSPARCTLYADYHEANLKKIFLVESAARLNDPSLTSQQNLVAREEYMSLNEAIFGEFDRSTFSGMINTELSRANAFVPQDTIGQDVKEYLLANLDASSFAESEPQLIDEELLSVIKETLMMRYADILSVVPDTGEDFVYGPQECEDIMNAALRATDLYDKGWRVELNKKKTAPATNAELKKIYLPIDTNRTANELKRLIVHEQEVHARRGQNGEETGEKPLALGTANYADVEEGLGVILECAIVGNIDNPSYHRARDRYILAGIALGADGTPRDARQSYELMWRMLAVRNAKDDIIDESVVNKAKTLALTHIDNAYRSTNHAMPGVIYTKLKVYYEGLAKNVEYFRNFDGTIDDALDAAMVGKCDHTDEHELTTIQGVLQESAA